MKVKKWVFLSVFLLFFPRGCNSPTYSSDSQRQGERWCWWFLTTISGLVCLSVQTEELSWPVYRHRAKCAWDYSSPCAAWRRRCWCSGAFPRTRRQPASPGGMHELLQWCVSNNKYRSLFLIKKKKNEQTNIAGTLCHGIKM